MEKDTDTLIDFRFTPILTAENGKNGAGQRAAGRSGKDLIVEVPIGTVVYKVDTKDSFEGGPELGKARSSASRPWRRAGWTRPRVGCKRQIIVAAFILQIYSERHKQLCFRKWRLYFGKFR